MRLLKTQFARYFAVGFAAGIALVATVMGGPDMGRDLANGVVPAAEAAPVQ